MERARCRGAEVPSWGKDWKWNESVCDVCNCRKLARLAGWESGGGCLFLFRAGAVGARSLQTYPNPPKP